MRAVDLGAASVLLCRAEDGRFTAWHNSCRHRGSELCPPGAERRLGKRITCPYHAWAYGAADGRLISTAHAHPTADFRPAEHGLIPVALRLWAGFVFLSTAASPGALESDVPLATLDRWPMESLVTGHRWEVEIACNWKVFWENYSECLHCPGIHPELCAMVPVYGRGIMAANEAQGWTPPDPDGPDRTPGRQPAARRRKLDHERRALRPGLPRPHGRGTAGGLLLRHALALGLYRRSCRPCPRGAAGAAVAHPHPADRRMVLPGRNHGPARLSMRPKSPPSPRSS